MKKIKEKIDREGGQVVLIGAIFFLVISLTVVLAISFSVTSGVRTAVDFEDSSKSFVLSESLGEDVAYRILKGLDLSSVETLTIDGNTATATTTDVLNGKEVVVEGNVDDSIRRVQANFILGGGATFNLALQTGIGGLEMDNNSKVIGNVYSGGDIIGNNGASITGSAIVAGSGGLIDNVDVGTSTETEAWSNEVKNSTIAGDLYCQSGSSNNKSCDTSRADAEQREFPITDEMITDWKNAAAAGGTHNGDYEVSGNQSFGPKKITGKLVWTSNNKTLTLTGPLWVEDEVVTSNGSKVKLDSSYGADSEIIVTDGKVTLSNNANFEGSGTEGSFIMVLTTSTESEAIKVDNNAGAVILNAQKGGIKFSNNSGANQATAKTLILDNGAEITYETGLADIHFNNGPSGGFSITGWGEI